MTQVGGKAVLRLSCSNCNAEFDRKKPDTRSKAFFCSRDCISAYQNNTRRSPSRTCGVCGCTITSSSKSGNCRQHKITPPSVLDTGLVKGDLFKKRKNYQSARSAIRKHAARIYKAAGLPESCGICGYSVFTEVCHKKAVKDFSDTALLTEVNAIGNLIRLCPNHHKEFDSGLLLLD